MAELQKKNRKSQNKLRRVVTDVQEAAVEPGFKIAFVQPDNYDRFYIWYKAEGTRYNGLTIILELAMKEYPLKAPHLKVLTPSMWHPNISKAGTVCVDFLYNENQWSSEYTIVSMMRAFQLLLEDANVDGGHHNSEASALWRDCLKEGTPALYIQAVKKNTGPFSHQYDTYFSLNSPHYIIPIASAISKSEDSKQSGEKKTSMLAKKFANKAKKVPPYKLTVSDENHNSDSDLDSDTNKNEKDDTDDGNSADDKKKKKKKAKDDSDKKKAKKKTKDDDSDKKKKKAKKKAKDDDDSNSSEDGDSDSDEKAKKEKKKKKKKKKTSKTKKHHDSSSDSEDV